MFFIDDAGKNVRNSTIRLSRGLKECRTAQVYLKENIHDKLTPLEAEMHYNLKTNAPAVLTRRKRAPLEPIIDLDRGTVQRDSLNILKNCGSDNICIPDLQLHVELAF